MDRKIFVRFGLLDLVLVSAILALFGIEVALSNSFVGVFLGLFVAGGVASLLAGYGVSIGPISWRSFAAASYVLTMVPTVVLSAQAGIGEDAAFPAPIVAGTLAITAVLFVAIAVDIALDTGVVVTIEPRTG